MFRLGKKRRKFSFTAAIVAACAASLGLLSNTFADMHYRFELAYYGFQRSKAEQNWCNDNLPSCRSFQKRLNDAWLGFNAGRNRNPLILYKKYRVYIK